MQARGVSVEQHTLSRIPPHNTIRLVCRALRLLASPGKSGSAFFLSDDDRFLIKTVQQEEMRLLLELIPKYYRHVEENSGTLLTRFHGLHMVKPVGGAKSRVRSRLPHSQTFILHRVPDILFG